MAEDLAVAAARRAEDDDLGLPALRLLDDRAARLPGAHEAVDRADAVDRRCLTRLVEQPVGLRVLRGQRRVERQLHRDDDHPERDDRRAALGRETGSEVDRLASLRARDDPERGSSGTRAPWRGRAGSARVPSRRAARRFGGGRSRRRRTRARASRGRHSASARPGRRRRARRPPCRGRRRPRTAASRRRGCACSAGRGTALRPAAACARICTTDACAIVNESIAPNAYMRPMKSTFPGSRKRIEKRPAKTTRASAGVLKRGCSRRKTSGSCR